MNIRYEGGVVGRYALDHAVKDEGINASFPPPIEERSAGQQAVTVAMHIAEVGVDTAAAAGLAAGAKRAIAKVRERFPATKATIDDEDE